MTTTDAPRVFLSHSSEDKNRFVLEFATHLRSRGIDVWLDRWEMYPGDSLVDKIFDEGLKSAEAVIVVVSENSVGSKWVREELNAGYVARLNKGTRLIPVILDDIDVPEALKSTVWVSINDVEDYSSELDRIVAAIFGVRTKPPLGSPPAFQQSGFSIPGLSELTSVISEIVNNGRKNNHELMQAVGQKKFLVVEHILHVLESNDLIKVSRASSRYAHIHSASPRLRRLLESGGA